MKKFVVIGLGMFGFYITKSLYEKGHEVIAIDKNKDIVQKIKDAELNDLLLLNQKARSNLHKRFDEGSPNVIESTAVMDRTFNQTRLLQNQATQNIDIKSINQHYADTIKSIQERIAKLKEEERDNKE